MWEWLSTEDSPLAPAAPGILAHTVKGLVSADARDVALVLSLPCFQHEYPSPLLDLLDQAGGCGESKDAADVQHVPHPNARKLRDMVTGLPLNDAHAFILASYCASITHATTRFEMRDAAAFHPGLRAAITSAEVHARPGDANTAARASVGRAQAWSLLCDGVLVAMQSVTDGDGDGNDDGGRGRRRGHGRGRRSRGRHQSRNEDEVPVWVALPVALFSVLPAPQSLAPDAHPSAVPGVALANNMGAAIAGAAQEALQGSEMTSAAGAAVAAVAALSAHGYAGALVDTLTGMRTLGPQAPVRASLYGGTGGAPCLLASSCADGWMCGRLFQGLANLVNAARGQDPESEPLTAWREDPQFGGGW